MKCLCAEIEILLESKYEESYDPPLRDLFLLFRNVTFDIQSI